MPIPPEILAVARPVNTVVHAYGKNRDRYLVIERTGCRYVGGRRYPVNGRTVGHIINLQYVPLPEPAARAAPRLRADVRDWGDVLLCDRLLQELLAELTACFTLRESLQLYCIAILRVCHPGIADCALAEQYDQSWLSELYPGVGLSRNTVSHLHQELGRTRSRISQFMRRRAAAVDPGHHLLLDGTLKSDTSVVNTLSDFSRHSRITGARELPVLFAYDLEQGEVVCSQCFPGNMPDARSYSAFITDCGLTRGLIVADRGFPAAAAAAQFAACPQLHHLNPIPRNRTIIRELELHLTSGQLRRGDSLITWNKARWEERDSWLYAFRDSTIASQDEQAWLRRHGRQDYAREDLAAARERFGLLVLESDLDMAPDVAYQAYAARWEIEIVMRYYKSACAFDITRVHADNAVIGSEFCDFLATILTFRLVREFDRHGLLESMTYLGIMRVLARAKKVRLEGEDQDWRLARQLKKHEELLEQLGLIDAPAATEGQPAARRRGRPRKNQV